MALSPSHPGLITMTKPDYLASMLQEIEAHWFPQHAAMITPHGPECQPPVTLLRWRQLGTHNYAIHYLLYDGTLFVTGDVGEAIYTWNESIDLPFLAQTSLDYFLSKRSGLQGREPSTEFCEEHAVEWIQHVFDHGHLHGTAALQSFLEFGDWRQHVASGPQWEHHLHHFIEETGDFDGDDFRILSRAPTSHDRRAVSHWLGLRLAHAKLSKQPLHYENGTFTSK